MAANPAGCRDGRSYLQRCYDSRMKVAATWFDITRVDDGVTRLTEPYVNATWRSNIWHVRGRNADMIVDAGMGVAPLLPAMASLIDRPVIAAATHRHSDHVGGLHEFATRAGHVLEAPDIAAPPPATLSTAHFPAAFKQMLANEGSPLGDLLIEALPHPKYDVNSYAIEPAPLTRLLAEGDTIDLGDRAFAVLHLPGHTPGSIGLWEERTGLLFSGDAVYDGLIFDFLPESNITDYIATMRRLRELPVRVVHGGHEASFGRERLIALADAYLTRRARS